MVKIYISGKITGLPIEQTKQRFQEVEDFMIKTKFFSPVNPFKIRPFLGIKCWSCYMIADIWQLLKCDAILMQEGWETSRFKSYHTGIEISLHKAEIFRLPYL